jgi:ATP-dependent Clp protease ATP-binding subunit ClpA
MFNRFTQEARAVVRAAEAEADALGAAAIGREHLLLGVAAQSGIAASALESVGARRQDLRAEVVRSAGCLDADALASIGIDLDEVRRRVEESFGPGALARRGRRRGRPRFSPGAKKALELSLREALALGDGHIGAEHILLGVVRDPGEPAGTVLRAHGADPAAVRAAVLAARTKAA